MPQCLGYTEVGNRCKRACFIRSNGYCYQHGPSTSSYSKVKFIPEIIKKEEPTITVKKDEPSITIKKDEPTITIKKDEPTITIKKDDQYKKSKEKFTSSMLKIKESNIDLYHFILSLLKIYMKLSIDGQLLDTHSKDIITILSNYKIESSAGHIMVGDRFTDKESSYFFVERTARDPETRLKEWSDRNGRYTYDAKDHIFTEKILHRIFGFIKTTRVSNTKSKIDGRERHEVEWFKFRNELSFDDVDTMCQATVNYVNKLCSEKHKTYKKININTASKRELMSLSQIGDVRSDNIIEYREYNDFNSVDDIMRVKSIGQGIFNVIKDQICVK